MFSSPASSSSSSSSSSSTRSSPVHAASLVDPAVHPPALMQLIDIKLTRPVIDYIVDCVAETVDHALTSSSAAPASPRGRRRSPYLASFRTFAATVLTRAEVAPGTALVALVYIARARPHLSIALEEWALERVFLGALIAASKYANDSTLKNVHWALCTGVFGKRDVGRIEREFLDVLDWELGVREADVLAHHQGLRDAAFGHRRSSATHKKTPSSSSADYLVPPSPRAHAHTRRRAEYLVVPSPRAAPVVPELDPSSPGSSLASLSPRTPAPSAFPASPAPAKRPHAAHAPMDVDEPLPAHSQSQRGGSGSKLHDLLRAFPIPRHHHHAHAHGPVSIHVGA